MRYLPWLALLSCAGLQDREAAEFMKANPDRCKLDEQGNLAWLHLGPQHATDQSVRLFAQSKTLKELRIH